MATTARTAERLARLLGPGARTRTMMGEYVLYWRDRVVGGLYDERLLLKDVAAGSRRRRSPAIRTTLRTIL